MSKFAKYLFATALAFCAGCVAVFAEDADTPAVIRHKFVTPSMYISTNVWESIKPKVQPKLTAGQNITIDANNVISATGGSSGNYVQKVTTERVQAMTIDGGAFIGDSAGHVVVQSYNGSNYMGSGNDDLYVNGKTIHIGNETYVPNSHVLKTNGTASNLAVAGLSVTGNLTVQDIIISGKHILKTSKASGSKAIAADSDTGLLYYCYEGTVPSASNEILTKGDVKEGYKPISNTSIEQPASGTIQKIMVSAGTLAITFPDPSEDSIGDFIVYAINTGSTAVSLSFPAGTYYSSDENFNADLEAGVTALYFTEITPGVWAVGRQSLKSVTIE